MYTINWRGDNCKNYYKGNYKKIGFCDHITAGTRQSVFYWFTSQSNTSASSTFLIARDGSIDQYVKLENGAWTQGISSADGGFDRAIAPIVRDRKGTNPNLYLIGIEYEGYVEGHMENGQTVVINYGLDGSITEEQFYAGCWLKKYLQGEVEKKWGNRIPLARYNIEQHRRIDPKRKPMCPGDNFPVERQLAELAIADKMTLEAYEERLNYLQKPSAQLVKAYAIADRVKSLCERINDPKYGAECKRKVMLFATVESLQTVEDVRKRVVEDLYNKALKGSNEAVRKLNLYHTLAEEKGLL